MYLNRLTVEDVQWQEAKNDQERARMQYELPTRVLIVISAVGWLICLWLKEGWGLTRNQWAVVSYFSAATAVCLYTMTPTPEISFGSEAAATGVLSDLANKSIVDILERYGNNLDKLFSYKFITAGEYTILRAMREKELTIKDFYSAMQDMSSAKCMRDMYREWYDREVKDFVDFQNRVVRREPILPPEYES